MNSPLTAHFVSSMEESIVALDDFPVSDGKHDLFGYFNSNIALCINNDFCYYALRYGSLSANMTIVGEGKECV